MAISGSQTRIGISWVSESYALFKQAPQKWLFVALAYIGLFVVLPTVPDLQIFALLMILIWPMAIAVITRLYRNAEIQKQEDLSTVIQTLKPKMSLLVSLGFICLLYFSVLGYFLGEDATLLNEVANNQGKMTEKEIAAIVQKIIPFFFKFLVMLIPLYMITWFSPMLIAFNNYPLVKALKSSLAGVLQYLVALVAAWVMLISVFLLLTIISSMLASMLSAMVPSVARSLISFFTFGSMVIISALMLAFQYVSYRDVFRAA